MGEWDAPARPINVKKRRWLRTLAIICGGLALLLIVGYFVVTSAWFVKSVILPKAGAALHATITVEDASVSPFSSITVSKLQIQTTGTEPLLRAEAVHVRYSLWAILHGQYQVAEAAIASPVIQIIQNVDGASNLDPLLKAFGGQPKPKSTEPESAEAFRLDLHQLALENATLRYVKLLPAGGKQTAEIAGLNVNADTIANDRAGKVRISAKLKFDQGLAPPTNNLLTAKLGGEFDLAFNANLRPCAIKGSLLLNVMDAFGAFQDAAELNTSLEADLTSTEIRALALRVFKGTTPLGTLTVNGPFNPVTHEGRLNLDLDGIDHHVLNIGGTVLGVDLNATTVNSTNVIELAPGASAVTVNGKVAVNNFSLTQKGQTTPTLDVAAAYNATIDPGSKQALLNVFSIDALQNQTRLLRGALSKPMHLDWSGATNAVEESAFELGLTNLNLAEWTAVASKLAPVGRLSLFLNLSAQQAGRKLNLDFNTQLSDFSAWVAGNRTETADATLALQAHVDDFTKITLASLAARVARQKQRVLELGASGNVDLHAMDADLQSSLDVSLPSLAAFLSRPEVSVSSGTLKYTGRVLQHQPPPGQGANALPDRALAGAVSLEGLTARVRDCHFNLFAVNADCDLSLRHRLAEIKKLSATFTQSGQPGGTVNVAGTLDLGHTNGRVVLQLLDLNQTVVRSFAAPLLGSNTLNSISIDLSATATLDPQAGAALKGELVLTNLVLSDLESRFPKAPAALLVKLDAALKDDQAELRQCAGTIHLDRLSGGDFDINGRFNLKSKAGHASLKLNDLNQNILQPLLAPALGDKTLSSASVNVHADLSYDPAGESSVKGEFRVLDLLVTDPKGQLPRTPLTGVVKLDGSLRDNLAEIRQFIGYVKQGELLGGSFDVKGDYSLPRQVGQLEMRLTDLNQNALAPLLSGAFGDKKLESVSINLSGNARYDAQGESTVKGEVQVVNLLVRDPAGEVPAAPLTLALEFDGSLARQMLDLKKLQLTLNETLRAKQELHLTGTLDLTSTNLISGDLKLNAESLDLAPCYELFASRRTATQNVESSKPQISFTPSKPDPNPIRLPFGLFVLNAAVGHLYLREIEAANFAATVKIDHNTIVIDPLSMIVNGAPAGLRASADLGVPGYRYEFNLDVNRLPLEPVVNSFELGQRGQINGLLSVNTAIKGAGVASASLQRHLTGNASLTVTNANIRLLDKGSGNQGRGFSLATLLSGIFKPVGALLQLPDLTESSLNLVDAHADVSGGTVKLRSLLLQSPTFQATCAGDITLADPVGDSRLNDLPVGLALERSAAVKAHLAATNASAAGAYERLPNFVKVGGTLAKPEVKTDGLALSRGLLKKGSEVLQGAAAAGAAGILTGVGGTLSGGAPAAIGAAALPAAGTVALPNVLGAGPGVPKTQSPSLPQAPGTTASASLLPTLTNGLPTLTNALPKKPSAIDLLK